MERADKLKNVIAIIVFIAGIVVTVEFIRMRWGDIPAFIAVLFVILVLVVVLKDFSLRKSYFED